ncbi:MAG TPA: hypothetical protein VHV83_19330 [Armatimonadota bacterium]|nr:hypothetical protein [Armatimonadota bacterium]
MRSRWTAYRLVVMVAGIFLFGVLPVTSQMPDLGAFGPDGREADRQSKLLACLDYPDAQQMIPKQARFTFSLTIGGTVSAKMQDGSVITHTINLTASKTLTKSGNLVTESVSMNGNAEKTMPMGDASMKFRTKIAYQKTTTLGPDECPPDVWAVTYSPKQQVGYIKVGTFDINRNDAAFEHETIVAGQTMKDTTTFALLGETPCYAGASTPFKAVAAELNSTYKFAGGGGYVEIPWRKGTTSASGQFTMPMKALGDETGVNVDTAGAIEAIIKRDGPIAALHGAIPATLTVTWTIGDVPKPSMSIEPDNADEYLRWIPAPKQEQGSPVSYGNSEPISVTARLKGAKEDDPAPKGRIDFYLTEVSSHQGRCCNYPRGVAMKDDLRFVKTDGIIIDADNPKHAYSKDRVSEATVEVEALDTAAYGTIVAKCDELNLTAENTRTGKQSLQVPCDDDNNHVADGWEKQMGLQSHPTDWDGDPEPAGQQYTGDGLSLYREYRGCVVSENGRLVFHRLNPRKKELFIIDKGGIFDTQLWEKASGIAVYKLTDDLVYGGDDRTTSRVVDFTMGAISGQHKYAVRIETVNGIIEPDAPEGANPNAFGYSTDSYTPKDTTYCRVFPDRLRRYISDVYKFLDEALHHPGSDAAQTLAKSGLPRWLAERAFAQMGETNREKLAQQMITICAIHEVGHACGLPGHTVKTANGGQSESSEGSKLCPMRYPDEASKVDLSVLQILFKIDAPLPLQYDAFCKEKPYNCWGLLNVKD